MHLDERAIFQPIEHIIGFNSDGKSAKMVSVLDMR
jgi:hypothetical protein